MAPTFTFKKGQRETGLSSIASPHADIAIKWNGKQIGMIAAPSRFGVDHWQIRLVVKQEPTVNDPCPWRWATLRQRNETEADARQFVKDNAHTLRAKFDLTELGA